MTGEYSYQPYGATTLTGTDGGNPTRYAGREDDGSGQYYNRARYYSTTDQRFFSQDPLGFASGDTNLYAYTTNQPTYLTDPLGTKPQDASGCGGQSFSQDTGVVLAGGAVVPISQVKVGDQVQVTDPATGETSAQTVTAVWVNHDTDLMDVTVTTGGVTSTIHSTQHHPFWDDTRHAWVDADQLQAGDQLTTPDGTAAVVTGTATVAGAGDMWDLTVANTHDFYATATTPAATAPASMAEATTATLDHTTDGRHTYYVVAGATPVLVHNCGGAVDGHTPTCECNPTNPRSEVTLDRDSFEQARNTGLDLVGTLDAGSRAPLIGRLEAATETYGKLTGFTGRSGGEYREFRLDVDPDKGTHINVMTGKGASVRKWVVRWPGTSITPWLRRNA